MILPAFALYQPPGAQPEHRTELMITERHLKKGLVEMDPNAIDYVKRENYRLKMDNTNDMYLSYKLDGLVNDWQMATAFSSSIDEIVDDKNFKSIIDFGERMIPAILKKIQQEPSHLVWALNHITNRTISNKPISITEASRLWVQWGLKNKLID